MVCQDHEFSHLQGDEDHSGDEVGPKMAAHMDKVMDHFQGVMQKASDDQARALRQSFQKKVDRELERMQEQMIARIDFADQANRERRQRPKQNASLSTLTQTMQQPQRRPRPHPPMSARELSVGALEESKDPVVASNVTPFRQPLSHQAQNVPTLQQHVVAAREGKGIPPD